MCLGDCSNYSIKGASTMPAVTLTPRLGFVGSSAMTPGIHHEIIDCQSLSAGTSTRDPPFRHIRTKHHLVEWWRELVVCDAAWSNNDDGTALASETTRYRRHTPTFELALYVISSSHFGVPLGLGPFRICPVIIASSPRCASRLLWPKKSPCYSSRDVMLGNPSPGLSSE